MNILSKLGILAVFCTMVTAAATCDAAIVNGDFATGDFTGWTVFNDPDGTTNADSDAMFADTPNVVSFDVTGNGASLAAGFNVGRTGGPTINQGGGIFQTIQTTAGELSLSADIAVFRSGNNAQGGFFQLLVDGMVVDTVDVQAIMFEVPVRDTLTVDNLAVSAGSHEIRLTVQRRFPGASSGELIQYIDNISATGSATAVPEPTAAMLILIGGMTAGLCRRRRRVLN